MNKACAIRNPTARVEKSRRFVQQAGWKFMKCNYFAAMILAAFIVLPGSDFGFTAEPARNPASIQNTILTYTVQAGDTLFKIARTYNTTVSSLTGANNLKNSIIRVGQKLNIPIKAGSTIGTALASLGRIPGSGEEYESYPLRQQLVKTGISMLGIQYLRGGSRESGFDCSGLVMNLFSRFDITLPRSSRQQYGQGEKVDREKLEIGDLVFFSSGGTQPNHVGIYIGGEQFLHAALKAEKVIISDLNKTWYAERFLGGRRISDLWTDEQVPDLKETVQYSCSIKKTDSPLPSQSLLFPSKYIRPIDKIDLTIFNPEIVDQASSR
jgi:LysM repeat protein